jgi:hypothetical protein
MFLVRDVMATIMLAFQSEAEAQEAIGQLAQAGFGEVRARILDSTEPLSYDKTSTTSPMIDPDMGSVEVRPSDTPQIPEAKHDHDDDEAVTGTIPTTGGEIEGVHVMIEVDDENEAAVRRILGIGGGGAAGG